MNNDYIHVKSLKGDCALSDDKQFVDVWVELGDFTLGTRVGRDWSSVKIVQHMLSFTKTSHRVKEALNEPVC